MTIPSSAVPFDRRSFLATAFAAPLVPGMHLGTAGERCGDLSLAEVLAKAHELVATHLQGPAANDEAWVHAAAALLAQWRDLPPDPFGDMTAKERTFLDEHGWTFRRVDAAPATRERPAVITHQIHVPAGGSIPLHDHRGMFGAIVVAAGDVEIRSFDIVAGSRTTAEVVLQTSARVWLGPGRFALLTRDRDNVHEFRAGKNGVRLVDLFVWLDDDARSHDLTWLDDPATSPPTRRYRARWA
jgi:hypothetical protein